MPGTVSILMFHAEPNPLPDLAEKRLLSDFQAGDLKSCGCQSLLQLFVVTACYKAACGNDQKPPAELHKLTYNILCLTCAVKNANIAIINKIFHSDLLNFVIWSVLRCQISIINSIRFVKIAS